MFPPEEFIAARRKSLKNANKLTFSIFEYYKLYISVNIFDLLFTCFVAFCCLTSFEYTANHTGVLQLLRIRSKDVCIEILAGMSDWNNTFKNKNRNEVLNIRLFGKLLSHGQRTV
jgi:hypothetical protein